MRVALRFVPILALAAWLAASAAGPVKLDGLAAPDFDKLPPGAMLDVGGRVLTKAQLLSEIQTKSHLSKATGPKVDLGAAQAKLAADEKALVAAASSSVRAEWDTVAPSEKLAPVKAAPIISSIGPQPLRVWGESTIRGTGFGAEPGQVHLLGPFPGGHMTLPVCLPGGAAWGIVECAWRPGVVSTVGSSWNSTTGSGKLPVITGVQDGTLQIVVVTKNGERSAPFPVTFRARRVLKRLEVSDVQVVRSNPAEGGCGSGAPGATVSCGEGRGSEYPPRWHVGVDRISAKVKNGWIFDSRSSVEIVTTTNTGSNLQPFGFEIPLLVIGPDRTTAEVVCTYVSYWEDQYCSVDFLVTGPEGVPSR